MHIYEKPKEEICDDGACNPNFCVLAHRFNFNLRISPDEELIFAAPNNRKPEEADKREKDKSYKCYNHVKICRSIE